MEKTLGLSINTLKLRKAWLLSALHEKCIKTALLTMGLKKHSKEKKVFLHGHYTLILH